MGWLASIITILGTDVPGKGQSLVRDTLKRAPHVATVPINRNNTGLCSRGLVCWLLRAPLRPHGRFDVSIVNVNSLFSRLNLRWGSGRCERGGVRGVKKPVSSSVEQIEHLVVALVLQQVPVA